MGFLVQIIVLGVLLYLVLFMVCLMLWEKDTFFSKLIVGVILVCLALFGFGPPGWLAAYLIYNKLGRG